MSNEAMEYVCVVDGKMFNVPYTNMYIFGYLQNTTNNKCYFRLREQNNATCIIDLDYVKGLMPKSEYDLIRGNTKNNDDYVSYKEQGRTINLCAKQ